jgi:hypothetical protein
MRSVDDDAAGPSGTTGSAEKRCSQAESTASRATDRRERIEGTLFYDASPRKER